jgi:hypothetical protein
LHNFVEISSEILGKLHPGDDITLGYWFHNLWFILTSPLATEKAANVAKRNNITFIITILTKIFHKLIQNWASVGFYTRKIMFYALRMLAQLASI